MNLSWRALALLPISLALGCSQRAPDLDFSVQRVNAGYGHGEHTWLSMHLLATDSSGAALDCDEDAVEVEVSVSFDEGATWSEVSGAEVACGDGQGDVALVMDNSGSEADFLDELTAGATEVVDGVLAAGGRVSLVRVSTDAEVTVALTDDADDLEDGLDAMFMNEGWTALYDGIRMGNETLGGAHLSRDEVDEFDTMDDFCDAVGQLGVVVFTDGQENNSSEEQSYDHTAYPGDGIDTSVDDLYMLRVGGVTTPIYTIGLGDDVDEEGLEELATWTGGRHQGIDTEAELEDVYDNISDYFESTTKVCAEVGSVGCGEALVQVDWTWTDSAGTEYTGTETYSTTVDCPVDYTGRTVTILLTLSDPGIDSDTATSLAMGAVDWVSPSATPSVLMVLDDNHHNEDDTDAAYIAGLLTTEGYDVDYLDEPSSGIVEADVSGYDVVWFSNPGYPPDDSTSIDTLESLLADGGGVVLQGDDMSRGYASAFSMESLTMLGYVSNGTRFCGTSTDNNAGDDYGITVDSLSHPVTLALEGEYFTYGNDIDYTEPLEDGEEVLAWATLDGSSVCDTIPAIVAYDPD